MRLEKITPRTIELFSENLELNKNYQEALNVTRSNCRGRIWLIGSFLYKNLVHQMYKIPSEIKDIDFIVEEPDGLMFVPDGWTSGKNSCGGTRFERKDGFMVDSDPIELAYSERIKPTIQGFLREAPFNIHSLVYDVFSEELEGEKGIEALETRVVKVNCMAAAETYAKRKNKSINELLKEKAVEIDFKAEYI